MNADDWLCDGMTLQYLTTDDTGASVQRSVALPRAASRPLPQRPGPGQITTQSMSGDIDTWCDAGAACSRNIGTGGYINETKRNYLLTYNGQAYAWFSIALRVNLNGRSPRFEAWYDLDNNASVIFRNQYANCVEDKLFDGSCGHIKIRSDFALSNFGRYTSPLTSFAPLANSNDYFLTITGDISPGPDPNTVVHRPRSRAPTSTASAPATATSRELPGDALPAAACCSRLATS